MQQDGRTGHDRPAGSGAQGIDRQAGQPEIGQRRRELHRDPDGRIGCIDRGLERRLDHAEHAPDERHHGSECHRSERVRVVQRPEAVGRDQVDPAHELVEVATKPGGRQEQQPKDDPDREGRHQRGDEAPRPPAGRRRGVQRIRRVQMPNTARPSHRPRRMPPWIARTSVRPRPFPSCRRTTARSGSCTG